MFYIQSIVDTLMCSKIYFEVKLNVSSSKTGCLMTNTPTDGTEFNRCRNILCTKDHVSIVFSVRLNNSSIVTCVSSLKKAENVSTTPFNQQYYHTVSPSSECVHCLLWSPHHMTWSFSAIRRENSDTNGNFFLRKNRYICHCSAQNGDVWGGYVGVLVLSLVCT